MGPGDSWGQYSVERVESALRTRVVGYEFWAFATSVVTVGSVDDIHIKFNVLDACLVHARCCIEFLVGRTNKNGKRRWKPEDVRPMDFLDRWEPEPADAVAELDRMLSLLDQHLSHVSTARADLFGHRWDLRGLDTAISAVAAAFLLELSKRAPARFLELEPWLSYAATTRESKLADGGVADLGEARSGLGVVMIPPRGVPPGAWVAWCERYMHDKRINWS